MHEPTRRLIVMRHAKAESFAADDRDRGLTDRGVADARDAGRWATGLGLSPDVTLVSSARRTRQTWSVFGAALGDAVTVAFEDALYGAGTDTVLEFLRELPEDCRTAVFIGHNPAAGMLVQLLNDGAGDPESLDLISRGYPTSAVTVLTVADRWARLEAGSARVERAYVGRG